MDPQAQRIGPISSMHFGGIGHVLKTTTRLFSSPLHPRLGLSTAAIDGLIYWFWDVFGTIS